MSDLHAQLFELVDAYAHECSEDARNATYHRRTQEARDALSAALREVVADAERMQWLYAEHERIDPMAAIVWKWKCDRTSSEWVNSSSPQSIREHIDSARSTK